MRIMRLRRLRLALGLAPLLLVSCSSDCAGTSTAEQGTETAVDIVSTSEDAGREVGGNSGKPDAAAEDVAAASASDVANVEDVDGLSGPNDAVVRPRDGVCSAPGPTAPRVGDACDVIGASRCSDTGMTSVDTMEVKEPYACVRPNRLVCAETDTGLVWQDVPCPVPPESCALNQVVTCVEDGGGTRCCPLRCRQTEIGAGAGDPQKGTLLCVDEGQVLCRTFPWMHWQWTYECGFLEQTPFGKVHSDCLPWCGGCTYYHPATKCGVIPVCNCEWGGVNTECETDDAGTGHCPDLSRTDCVWSDEECR